MTLSSFRFHALALGSSLAGCTLSLSGVPVGDGVSDGGPQESPQDADGGPDGPEGNDGTDEDGGPFARDGSVGEAPCVLQHRVFDQRALDKLDLLFVIDNSLTMREEQDKLFAQVPELLRALTTGDLDDDGSQDRPKITSVHLGVVSSDLGTYEVIETPGCAGIGDDGLLQNKVSAAMAGVPACSGKDFADTYLSYEPAYDGAPAARAEQFACVATLGSDGCGFEQPLEAMWKALAGYDPDFVQGEGHGDPWRGDGANVGFVRDDAMLAVLHLADEDDCSVTSLGLDLFSPTSENPAYAYDGAPATLAGKLEGLNFRCAWEAHQSQPFDLVQPVARYVEGLKRLKGGSADRVVYAAITGMPSAAEGYLTSDPEVQDYARILAHADMQVRPSNKVCSAEEALDNPACGKPSIDVEPPAPACSGSAGSATPGRRLTQVAQGFGKNGVVGSICSESYAPVLAALARKITAHTSMACLDDAPQVSTGFASCEVRELLAPGDEQCDGKRGRSAVEGKREVYGPSGEIELRKVCAVNQVPVVNGKVTPNPLPPAGVSASAGFYYDTFSREAKTLCEESSARGRIAFTAGAEPARGALVSLECTFQPARAPATTLEALGLPCKSNADCPSNARDRSLCEKSSGTCQIACDVENECQPGFSCTAGYRDSTNAQVTLCLPEICPARRDPVTSPWCTGPFVPVESGDDCDEVSERWDVRSSVGTIEACFQLCADVPECRRYGRVDFNPATHSCILDASCSPVGAGYVPYRAVGGCSAPQQCWDITPVQSDCSGGGSSYYSADTVEECLRKCEELPEECGQFKRFSFSESQGACQTEPGCPNLDEGYVAYEYREIACPP